MAIICKTHIDVYKERAKTGDLDILSGRNNTEVTKYINHNILKKLQINNNEIICDIGCGDASLLKSISQKYNNCHCIGFLPTIEEVELVSKQSKEYNISIKKSFSNCINAKDNTFDKVICNGVIILLLDYDSVIETLQEIRRITRKNGIVYLGEIPENNIEQKSYGNSIILWLFDVLIQNGFKSFLQNLNIVIKSILTNKSFIIKPKSFFYMEHHKFIKLLEGLDFTVLEYEKHKSIYNNIEYITNRYNYLIKVNKYESAK